MPQNIDETEDELSITREVITADRRRVLVHVYREGDGAAGQRYDLAGGRRIIIGRRPGPGGIELSDSRASREHAEVVADRDKTRVIDRQSRNGTYVGHEKVVEKEIEHGAVIRVGSSLFVYIDIEAPSSIQLPEPAPNVAYARAIAEATADLAAPTELTVLLTGPTGAGKEVLASRIHRASRRHGPFVPLNCATLSRELIGSELFGHSAGAFSGAVKARSGLFVTASGGTLLLDEIAELPLDQQAALLRALQEKRVRPIGSDQEIAVDVRVIAATHQSLEQLERAGKFRADLHARLAGFVIELPGLAKRREEILPLFKTFLGDAKKKLTREAAEAILVYDWPHNVRELKHAAERARLLAQMSEEIDLLHLPPPLLRREHTGPSRSAMETIEERRTKLDLDPQYRAAVEASREAAKQTKQEAESSPYKDVELDKDTLTRLLDEHAGNIAMICRVTGKHRQQIYRWLKKYNLTLDKYRADDSPSEEE